MKVGSLSNYLNEQKTEKAVTALAIPIVIMMKEQAEIEVPDVSDKQSGDEITVEMKDLYVRHGQISKLMRINVCGEGDAARVADNADEIIVLKTSETTRLPRLGRAQHGDEK